jgi:hypothetical protein
VAFVAFSINALEKDSGFWSYTRHLVECSALTLGLPDGGRRESLPRVE